MTNSNPVANLASLSMRQLREFARLLGISRSNSESREALTEAIARAPQTPESLRALEAELSPAPRSEAETKVVFLPRDPQWAYVFWEIAAADREDATAAGATDLVLRVADVTGLPGGSSHPHALQEVVVDAHASEWYIPVPLSDRDYRVELGFRTASAGWYSLAFSSVARVPALQPSEHVADQFVPFCLDAVPSAAPAEPQPSVAADLHERLYQTATSRWRRLGRGSEAFHEFDEEAAAGAASGIWESGAGWASGRSESGAGLMARNRSFWLVADAELIVYGATDPSARLSIGGEVVPLSADGTFRIQVPFRDGHQVYAIEAVAADGEQKRNITLEFQRTTPEARVNTAESAVPEWF
ncbi:MAG: DUF4912 domain-containing protein [Cyanobium sp.]|jgi:hypothetical protein